MCSLCNTFLYIQLSLLMCPPASAGFIAMMSCRDQKNHGPPKGVERVSGLSPEARRSNDLSSLPETIVINHLLKVLTSFILLV